MGRASANSLTGGRAIALLRAVNVGGRSLKMEDLRQILHRLGYVEPRTLLQSGNAVFGFAPNSPVRTTAAVEAQIEEELQKRLSLQSDVFVRSAAEWNEAIAGNPFPKQAASDPAHLVRGLCAMRPLLRPWPPCVRPSRAPRSSRLAGDTCKSSIRTASGRRS